MIQEAAQKSLKSTVSVLPTSLALMARRLGASRGPPPFPWKSCPNRNNRKKLPPIEVFGERAKAIRATMLVTKRVGKSWTHETQGGCAVFGADGIPRAMADHDGKEEMIFYDSDL